MSIYFLGIVVNSQSVLWVVVLDQLQTMLAFRKQFLGESCEMEYEV